MMLLKDDDRKMWFKEDGMGIWCKTMPWNIKKGERFRIYTTEGRPFIINDHEIYVAATDPYQIQGVWTIEVNL